jgi:hypothetical protein
MRMIDKKKDVTYDVNHIVWTIFFIFYSFSAIEHRSQHSLFEDMSFNMFVAACIMAGHYFQWRYISTIPFLALPITMNVFFNALSNYHGHPMGHIFEPSVDIWEHGIPPYIALVVLMFNAFLIATVFSIEPLNRIRRFKKGASKIVKGFFIAMILMILIIFWVVIIHKL